MLDDMQDLRRAVEEFRAPAVAFGVPWENDGGDRRDNLPLGELRRVFGVDRIAEQVVWLNTEALPYARVCPDGAHPLEWADAGELLDSLGAAVGIPFPWRHQIPLLGGDLVTFTFVLAGPHEGEVWRYQTDPDDWNPMRAAPSLAAMLTEWTRGFAAGVYTRLEHNTWLHTGSLSERGLDPFAFPVHVSQYDHGPQVRARQEECGVDPEAPDDIDLQCALVDEIAAVKASFSTRS